MTDKVQAALEHTQEAMKKNGYEIGDVVEVMVDPKLGFMGYTMPLDGRYRIVVSGAAVDSGMLEGLLVHEMSHVYRMRTGHPSHNGTVIEEVVKGFGKRISRDYQQKILHDILNDIQDLYADDIAFKVLRNARLLPVDEITGFLQSWVKDEPYKDKNEQLTRWTNGGILVHNARALAQMTRHKVSDAGGKASAANARFMSQMPKSMMKNFEYFREKLVSLDENMSPEAYRRLLKNYISKFLETVDG